MKSIFSTFVVTISLVGLVSCADKGAQTKNQKMYTSYKNQSIQYVNDLYNTKYKTFKKYKAIAVSIDSMGKCSIGYSFHAKTQAKANKMAIKKCNAYKRTAESTCEIYAVGDKIIHPL
ncbi:MAG: hypothetical protein DSZ12_05365 [Sulfurovum sp.]|nr:MAG: hypothetical protein DSZ12_05365 [Sulfurovum sp.]